MTRFKARTAAMAVAATLGAATAPAAETPVDPAQIALGKQVFERNCVLCHRETGTGRPPNFPALAGNDRLQDLFLVVANVHEGQGFMPPFPSLRIEDIAAVANYVRNAWGNAHGGASPLEVATIMDNLDGGGGTASIWDAVYTEAQAARGREVFAAPCGLCHGSRLDGVPDDNDMVPGPPLARHKFLRQWDGRSLGALYSYASLTMPQSNPGSLAREDYVAIIALMLQSSGAPAGNEALPDDIRDLARIVIGPKP
ncbi:c-type cytochrome [Rhodovulum strictum]|uniref:C-type cytochrome n=1 Tax=Rhodovulum strictum TaxID=58314 RepID=A0A844B580_9RHOB|nr:c-type cytochrome [Rhodovulum strictum]MRH21351.1 c-type cytochrome [Rhodovulum strictum]